MDERVQFRVLRIWKNYISVDKALYWPYHDCGNELDGHTRPLQKYHIFRSGTYNRHPGHDLDLVQAMPTFPLPVWLTMTHRVPYPSLVWVSLC